MHPMPRSKEIPEGMRKKVVEIHQPGKGYKGISKGVIPMFSGSYVRQIYMAHNGNMTKGPMFPGSYVPQLYIAHNGNLKNPPQLCIRLI
uniref:Uncharacterized protein n=1 Tax=Anguilla anguilla TaxID=7936 RepID=A0A0E9XEX0_ANGAN